MRLSVCNLSWNGFGEDGGLAIADALLSNTTLKDLDISNNRLTYPVAVRLSRALLTNDSLERLKVVHLFTHSYGIPFIAHFLVV